MLKTILLVGTGGFIGSVARYFTSKLNLSIAFFSVPCGTLIVNVLGCFLIGLLSGFAEKNSLLSNEFKLFLMVGFCGGFTTFSAFANENVSLMQSGQFFSIFLYTLLSIILGFGAVFGGYLLSRM